MFAATPVDGERDAVLASEGFEPLFLKTLPDFPAIALGRASPVRVHLLAYPRASGRPGLPGVRPKYRTR